jgi:hypothetical protein
MKLMSSNLSWLILAKFCCFSFFLAPICCSQSKSIKSISFQTRPVCCSPLFLKWKWCMKYDILRFLLLLEFISVSLMWCTSRKKKKFIKNLWWANSHSIYSIVRLLNSFIQVIKFNVPEIRKFKKYSRPLKNWQIGRILKKFIDTERKQKIRHFHDLYRSKLTSKHTKHAYWSVKNK